VGLQIVRDQSLRRREWRLVRAGWLLLAVLIGGALLGLLGPGPLSWTTARSEQGLLEVEFQRFSHLEADDLLTVTASGGAAQGDTVDLVFGLDWVRAVTITDITPQPSDQTLTPEGLRLTLPVERGADVPIQIAFRPSDVGRADGVVAVEGDSVTFGQFVYP
jgi:hypothetical protein